MRTMSLYLLFTRFIITRERETPVYSILIYIHAFTAGIIDF